MKQTKNIAKTIVVLIASLWVVIYGNIALSQTYSLRHGEIIVNGTTYNISIQEEYKSIYIHNRSADTITEYLYIPNSDATFIPEHFIPINKEELLEIKRRFYPSSSSRVRVSAILTKGGDLIGMEYALPKSPMITEQQFGELDAQVRKHLKVSIVFPNERIRNQKHHGYTKKTVILW